MTGEHESISNGEDKTEQIDAIDFLDNQTQQEIEPEGAWCIELLRGPTVGETIYLKDGVNSFGRGPDCDIFLDDITVSRNHCDLVLENDSLTVIDRGSTNGTYVSSKEIDKSEVKVGDTLQIGRFVFKVTRRSA